jgi:hypothetical protein
MAAVSVQPVPVEHAIEVTVLVGQVIVACWHAWFWMSHSTMHAHALPQLTLVRQLS